MRSIGKVVVLTGNGLFACFWQLGGVLNALRYFKRLGNLGRKKW